MVDERRQWHGGPGHISLAGPIWIMGWLFTLGYLAPSFWKGVLAILLWPYYLGISVR
jgi:hypothetical protein